LAQIVHLRDAIRELVHDGDFVALEGFTHLIPFAAGHEIIRQGRRDLTLVRMTPDVIYDQLIGAGCARKLIFSWGGNPGVGSLHRLRDAVEKDWPVPLEVEEHAHAGHGDRVCRRVPPGCHSGCCAGILAATCRSSTPTSSSSTARLPASGWQQCRRFVRTWPSSTRRKPDRQGNVLLWGVTGVQKEAVLAAKRSIVTVEEVVDRLDAAPNAVVLPTWVVGAVCHVPGGARFRPMPSAITAATMRSTRNGTRSRASATLLPRGSTGTCEGPATLPSSSAVSRRSRGRRSNG
jgi:glutaconate CoA-transferase subunit A